MIKPFIALFPIILLAGCSITRPYDDLWFRHYGVREDNLYVLVERSHGKVTHELGPDPRDSYDCNHFELYRLTYNLNPENKNKTISPEIEKVIDNSDVSGSRSPSYDAKVYLPTGAFLDDWFSRSNQWAYTDWKDEDLLSSSEGLITQQDIDKAHGNNFPINETKRIFRYKNTTILYAIHKNEHGLLIDPHYLYSPESQNKYQFPNGNNPSLRPMFSETGACFFVELHDHRKISVLSWNPVSDDSMRWILSKPSKRMLSETKQISNQNMDPIVTTPVD